MFTPEQLQTLKTKVDNAQTIALFGHHNVDGDAVGSLLGLGKLLENLGKDVSCYTTTLPGKSFAFVQDIQKIRNDFDYKPYDLVFFLDFTGYHRITGITAGHEEYFDASNLIVVDHHIDDAHDKGEHAFRLKDIDCSSNCELLLEICQVLWPEHIDKTVATHWMMGLLTDTGCFQFQKDSVRTFGNAQTLIKYGADKNFLIEKLFNSNPQTLVGFIQLVIPRLQFSKKVCSLWYTIEELEQYNLDLQEAESVMVFIRSIYGFALFNEIRVQPDVFRCSLRAGYTDTGRINTQLVAKAFGGGGHMYAAGCNIERKPDLSIEDQIATINSLFEKEVVKQLP